MADDLRYETWQHEPPITAATPWQRGLCFGGAWLAAAVTLGGIGFRGAATDPISGIGERIGNVIVVHPERMVSQPFGLAQYIDIGDQLTQGRWLVILYQADCGKCDRLLLHLASREFEAGASLGVAYVLVPPRSIPGIARADFGRLKGVHGCLREEFNWFVNTPTVLLVEHNRVVAMGPGLEEMWRLPTQSGPEHH